MKIEIKFKTFVFKLTLHKAVLFAIFAFAAQHLL